MLVLGLVFIWALVVFITNPKNKLHNMTQTVYLVTTKHILGGQKNYLSGKIEEAASTKVLLGITSICTYNVKIKAVQKYCLE
jgi:hypothetical protein